MPCSGCEVRPSLPEASGVFLIAPALGHTQAKLATALEGDWKVSHPAQGLVSVELPAGALPLALRLLTERLSEPELDGSRAVFVPSPETFGPQHLAGTRPLSTFVAQMNGGWLGDLVDSGSLTCHLQPILAANAPSDPFAYECLLRGVSPDGSLVFPDRLFSVARAAEMTFLLDRAARLTAIRVTSELDIQIPVFINFNPNSIYDPAYCLRTTIEAAHRASRVPSQFVFEVVESDLVTDVPHLLRVLGAYRDSGFRVALDDLGAGFSSLNLLSRLRPDFVKFDLQLVRDVDSDPYKASILGKLVEMAGELGIGTVAEGVETEAEWQWLRERGVDYVQGYLFARPALPPLPVSRGATSTEKSSSAAPRRTRME